MNQPFSLLPGRVLGDLLPGLALEENLGRDAFGDLVPARARPSSAWGGAAASGVCSPLVVVAVAPKVDHLVHLSPKESD